MSSSGSSRASTRASARRTSSRESSSSAPDRKIAADANLREQLAEIQIRAPTRGNRRLEALIEAANADEQLKAWWHLQQTTAKRLGMSDHSLVHVQIVVNMALRLFRLLKRVAQPATVADH